jgi:hypothetical protein
MVQAIEQRGQDSRRSKYRALKNFGQCSFEDGRRFSAIELDLRSEVFVLLTVSHSTCSSTGTKQEIGGHIRVGLGGPYHLTH